MTESTQLKNRPFVSEWRAALMVGDSQIDMEHRMLFALVKDLDHEHVEQTVSALKDYASTHFMNEQEMMGRLNYPNVESHIALHEDFKKTVSSLCEEQIPWTAERVMELRRFLNQWLIGHIGTHDQHFGQWIRASRPLSVNTSVSDAKSGFRHSAIYAAYKAILRKLGGWFR
jgi:hemerythrin